MNEEPVSPLVQEETKVAMPSVPISDEVWRKHLAIKQALSADSLNNYAGELAVEMRLYC